VLQVPRKDADAEANSGDAGPADAASSVSPLGVSVPNCNEGVRDAGQANLPSPIEKPNEDGEHSSLTVGSVAMF
jgi:hypothetical protein